MHWACYACSRTYSYWRQLAALEDIQTLVHETTSFFPSCASVALARSSHLVVLMKELRKCIHCASLGVQKWSKITTKWCQFQNEKPTKTQQKTNTHNPHPKQHQTKTKRKREHGMTAPKSNGISCFWISRSCTKTSRQQTKRQQLKITRRCSAKHIDQQCRNPGSPLPGSRRSHWGAFRHKTPSQSRYSCSEL